MGAARTERGLVVLLLGLAGLAWWSSADRMEGMGSGPWTALSTLGWFLGIWIVMMAAMMLPSAIPTVTLYGSLATERRHLASVAFVAGYLAVWAAAGLVAFALATAGGRVAGGVLAWDRAGRWAAGATLLVAAAYQLTPLKNACLAKCRSPLGFLLGSWRPGAVGGFRLGLCERRLVRRLLLGADGVAVRARRDEHRLDGVRRGARRAREDLPWRRLATGTTATLLTTLGVLLLAAPGLVPGLALHPMGPMP